MSAIFSKPEAPKQAKPPAPVAAGPAAEAAAAAAKSNALRAAAAKDEEYRRAHPYGANEATDQYGQTYDATQAGSIARAAGKVGLGPGVAPQGATVATGAGYLGPGRLGGSPVGAGAPAPTPNPQAGTAATIGQPGSRLTDRRTAQQIKNDQQAVLAGQRKTLGYESTLRAAPIGTTTVAKAAAPARGLFASAGYLGKGGRPIIPNVGQIQPVGAPTLTGPPPRGLNTSTNALLSGSGQRTLYA